MKTFEIHSSDATLGSFDGETAAHAIVAYHRAAGLRSVVGADGEVQHDPRDVASGAVVPSQTEALRAVEVTNDATYSVTFTDADTEEAYDAAAQASEEPQTLADVIEICTTYGIAATLRDPAGFIKGWVHGDGNYTLR